MKKFAVYPVLCAVSTCICLISSGLTYASWQAQGETVNKISMESVKGQIIEEYEQNQVVYPNATVDKVVQVKNTGTADAVPRVKIEKAWGDSRDENGKLLINPDLSTDNIEITYCSEQWKYNPEDGYFYYQGVLKPGEVTAPLLDNFVINGEKTGGEYKNKYADVIVNMELVQAAGGGLSYWDTSLEELGITYTPADQTDLVTTVSFHDPDEGFSFDLNEGDLFADFKNLVPGESRSQLVTVTNDWDYSVQIYLWADFIDQTQATDETRELIDKLLKEYATIVITEDSGNIIYSGAVWGSPDVDSQDTDSMKYPHNLGVFKGGETKNLNISLYLDPKMDNEYKELLGLIKWVFSASGEEPAPPTDKPSDEPTDKPSEEPTDRPSEEPTGEPTAEPSDEPTAEPSEEPTAEPTDRPSEEPTDKPSEEPSAEPSEEPTAEPSAEPSGEPTAEPTAKPTEKPGTVPTAKPTDKPGTTPTAKPGTSSSTGGNSAGTSKVTSGSVSVNPKTGNAEKTGIYLTLALISLVLIPITYKKSKEQE